MEKNYSNLIVESANKIMDEAMEVTKKDITASNKQLATGKDFIKKQNAAQRANKGKGTAVIPSGHVDTTKKPAGMLTKASGMAKRGAGAVQNKWGKMGTGSQVAVGAAAVGLAGLAAWKIKKARCKKNCQSSSNPQECMAKC
jgi:hypothetical protein